MMHHECVGRPAGGLADDLRRVDGPAAWGRLHLHDGGRRAGGVFGFLHAEPVVSCPSGSAGGWGRPVELPNAVRHGEDSLRQPHPEVVGRHRAGGVRRSVPEGSGGGRGGGQTGRVPAARRPATCRARFQTLGDNGVAIFAGAAARSLFAKDSCAVVVSLAVSQGHTVRFTSAGQFLGELASLDSDSALRRRLRHYASPQLLVIDEVGYLSYSNRYADLLFELISRRYEQKSTIVTTNRPFVEWRDVFPNAACVVSLVDRLIHKAEVFSIEGESYRLKEARELAEKRAKKRKASKT